MATRRTPAQDQGNSGHREECAEAKQQHLLPLPLRAVWPCLGIREPNDLQDPRQHCQPAALALMPRASSPGDLGGRRGHRRRWRGRRRGGGAGGGAGGLARRSSHVPGWRRRGRGGGGAVEGHLVAGVRRAPQQAHAVVVRITVHAWAHLVHAPHKLRVSHWAFATLLWRLRWRRAAIRCILLIFSRQPVGVHVSPLIEEELAAGAVATHRLPTAQGVDDSQVHRARASCGQAEILCHGAAVKCQLGAIDDLGGLPVRPAGGGVQVVARACCVVA
mmetsp:Transcript_87211/g.241869  ORF Transcript_87211/g.241869 Transcript_87211/m.241869 type:complete len:275 (+) Transcript_87211:418-1242(+)